MVLDGLRVFVDGVDRDVGLLSKSADAASVARLVASWGKLVEFLALGPTPELRACPHCGAVGMRAATLCGVCWKKLVPPEAHAAPPSRARNRTCRSRPTGRRTCGSPCPVTSLRTGVSETGHEKAR